MKLYFDCVCAFLNFVFWGKSLFGQNLSLLFLLLSKEMKIEPDANYKEVLMVLVTD
jgi:hypothetical protein